MERATLASIHQLHLWEEGMRGSERETERERDELVGERCKERDIWRERAGERER